MRAELEQKEITFEQTHIADTISDYLQKYMMPQCCCKKSDCCEKYKKRKGKHCKKCPKK